MPRELESTFDRNAVRTEIIQRFKEIKRKPGDPRLRVELADNLSITALNQCPPDEIDRRRKMRDYEAYVKVVVNSKEVSKTPAASLSDDFELLFGEVFPLKVSACPSSIVLQLWEHSITHGDTLISEAHLPIPQTTSTRANTELSVLEFSSDRVLRFDFVETSHVG